MEMCCVSFGKRFGGGGMDIFVNLLLMYCLGTQLCFAFSVHLPSDDELPEKHEKVSLLENFDGSSFQIHKRQNSKTATCTCTCETKPEDGYNEESESPSWSFPGDDNTLHSMGRKPADDEPAHHLNAQPPSDAPSFDDQTSENNVAAQDHSLNKLTAERVSELEPAERMKPGYGHGSLYPWKSLPSRTCYREPCTTDRDCCLDFNICDRSARVCVDCWYGSSCMTERDCCLKYPHCKRPSSSSSSSHNVIGKCVNTQ